MRAASSDLIAALAAGTPMWSADLFTLSLPDSTTYYWTSADQAVSYGGTIWSAGGPLIERTSWASKNTTEIADMQIQLYSTGDDFGTGNNIKTLIVQGLFDGAYMLLQRAFMPAFGNTSLGLVTLFGGLIGETEVNSLGAKLTVTASNVLLEQNIPRRTYEASCLHTLFDSGCTLAAGPYTDGFTVAWANAMYVAWVTAPASDSSIYFMGTMNVLSGAGAGQSVTVTNYNTAGVAFSYPLLTIPAPGDSCNVVQGCWKTVARCQALGNILNFGGFPYIPPQSAGL